MVKFLPYKVGDTINFSGQIGCKRSGVIEKIWSTNTTANKREVHFCTVVVPPEYVWEKDPVNLIVCLTPGFYDHPYCVTE